MCDIEFSDTLFLKYLGFSHFYSELIEIWYSGWKHVEVVCYKVSCGYAALIEIHDWLKTVFFSGLPDICNLKAQFWVFSMFNRRIFMSMIQW